MSYFEIAVENALGGDELNKNFTITGLHSGLSFAGNKKFTIVFDKFFPYDNGNNEPIYDTSNGEVLRDPVTGLPVT